MLSALGGRLRRLVIRDEAQGALLAEVLALAWPAVLQGLLGTVMLLTDRLMLGRYAPEALGSMQVSGPVLWSSFSLMGAFGVGGLAVLGRLCGAQRYGAARRTAGTLLRLAVGLGLLTALVGLWLRDHAGLWLAAQASETVRGMSSQYMGVVFLAAPFELLGVAGTAALQGAGDTRTPMKASMVTALLNVVVTYLLCFGVGPFPEWGVLGAGIGTATAFTVHGLWMAWASTARLRSLERRGPVAGTADGAGAAGAAGAVDGAGAADGAGAPLRAVLRISGPALVERVIYHTGYLIFSSFIGRLGDAAMTAHQALLAIESLGFIAADGFGIAAGAIIARKLGAQRPDDAAQGVLLARRLGVLTLSLVGLLFLLVPGLLMTLFTDDPQVHDLGVRCLRVAAIAQPAMAFVDALSYGLRGAGDTRQPLKAAILGPVIVRLSACWFFAFTLDLGLWGIWIGTNFDWFARAIYLDRVFKRGAWRSVRL